MSNTPLTPGVGDIVEVNRNWAEWKKGEKAVVVKVLDGWNQVQWRVVVRRDDGLEHLFIDALIQVFGKFETCPVCNEPSVGPCLIHRA